GPMSPRISRSPTSKLTSETATSPPKRRVMPLTRRTGVLPLACCMARSLRGEALRHSRQPADNAVRQQDHRQGDDRSEEQLLIGAEAEQVLSGEGEDDGAEDRPRRVAVAAQLHIGQR